MTTNQTRIRQAKKALAAKTPQAHDLIAWVDDDIATVNGSERMPEAELARRYPGKHTVIRLGIDLSEV
jgi:hypothetical protein